MGRPERPLDPDQGPVEAFAHELRELRARAGRPSYASMARRAHRSQTALSEAAGGEKLATWDTTEAYVQACSGDIEVWRRRWEDVARSTAPPLAATPDGDTPHGDAPAPPATTPDDGEPAPPPNEPGRSSRFRLAAGAMVLVAATAAVTVALTRPELHRPSASAADVAPSDTAAVLTAAPSVVDGADPKDSGCALDPAVVTLDSAEVDFRGLPAGLAQLRYSPMCGVAWPRFEPFPKASIPTGALIHVDVVRPAAHDLRLPFAAPYTGVPVYGNVMISTSRCVYAAASIEMAGSALPESRTHCFRGRTAELTAS